MMRTFSEAVVAIAASAELLVLVKATVAVALGLAAVRIARSTRASVRHLLLISTFAALLALPVAMALVPAVRFEIPTTHVDPPVVSPVIEQVKGPPTTAARALPYWKTGEICRVPAFPQQAIAWDKEAARVIFAIAPVLLADTAHGVIPRATGELVWVPLQEKIESSTPYVYPVLFGHAPCERLQAERVTIVPSLPVRDPLLHHIALVLQAAVDAEDEAGQLYAETLADALVVHFLRRYAAARPAQREVSGGLAPYKLRRTLAYIQAHLGQKICLETLAAVAQMSLTHFAHMFKHATGILAWQSSHEP